MQKELQLNNISELSTIAQKVIELIGKKKIVLFNGPMGAGKTTLIKEICRQMGVKDNVSSPTFSIVNEYKTQSGEKIFHFDFYRIKSETEAYDMGYEDYFYSNAYCFIEWSEKIQNLLPQDSLPVNLSLQGTSRVLLINH
jgi:tRNA threonylcarbamoyladenosine biosynthesis protein TsaE